MKITCLRSIVLTATLLCATFSIRADILTVSSEATVRGGTFAATDVDEVTDGYLMVKYSSSLSTTRKTYFQFDFSALNPDTNAIATFTVIPRNSYQQRVQIWALEQSYPTMNTSLTWDTAQANDTGSANLLTNGPWTAVRIGADLVVPTNGTTPFTFTLPRLGDYLHDQRVTLVLTALDDPLDHANGLRLRLGQATLAYEPYTDNQAPSITSISNQTIVVNHSTGPIPFVVGDDNTFPDSIEVWANSSNEGAVPINNIVLEIVNDGIGSNRTVNVTAGAAPGTATITLFARDSLLKTSQTSFTVTVLPDNYPPMLSVISNMVVIAGQSAAPIAFTVRDLETPEVVSVSGVSGNPVLVDPLDIVLQGAGTDWTVTVTPVPNQTGVAPISLIASDGFLTSTSSFAVMVLPATNVAFLDHFDYADGLLNSVSAGFWALRTSGNTKLTVTNHEAILRANGSSWESCLAPLAFGPYAPGGHALLYLRCQATWTTLPRNSTGPFIHLNDGSTGGFECKISTTTNDLPDGFFRLQLSSGPGPYTPFPRDLTTNTPYTLIARYDVDAGTSALWIDAASEADPSLTAVDVQPPISIANVGLRQQAGVGTVQLDNVQVSTAFRPAITTVRIEGSSVVLDFTAGPTDVAGDFSVLGGDNVAAPFGPVNASITELGGGRFRASFAQSGGAGFYRLIRQPLSFQ